MVNEKFKQFVIYLRITKL